MINVEADGPLWDGTPRLSIEIYTECWRKLVCACLFQCAAVPLRTKVRIGHSHGTAASFVIYGGRHRRDFHKPPGTIVSSTIFTQSINV